jgi:hypothetical protein
MYLTFNNPMEIIGSIAVIAVNRAMKKIYRDNGIGNCCNDRCVVTIVPFVSIW